jgi:hypothetical protein
MFSPTQEDKDIFNEIVGSYQFDKMTNRTKFQPTTKHYEFWQKNITIAKTYWSQVQPERVIPGLTDWVCETHACFGGHLAT